MEKSDCPFSYPNVPLFTVNMSWSLSHWNSEDLSLWSRSWSLLWGQNQDPDSASLAPKLMHFCWALALFCNSPRRWQNFVESFGGGCPSAFHEISIIRPDQPWVWEAGEGSKILLEAGDCLLEPVLQSTLGMTLYKPLTFYVSWFPYL